MTTKTAKKGLARRAMGRTTVQCAALSAVVLASACGFNQPGPDPITNCPPTGNAPQQTPPPVFAGEAKQADVAPPPLSGGTLAIFSRTDGAYIVASIPESDRIAVVHVTGSFGVMGGPGLQHDKREIALQPGDEPGRIIEDGAGRVHVVLRRAGALLTLDPQTMTIVGRRDVCPAPRGVAYDAVSESVLVACATGELVTLPAAGGPATRRVWVDRDLRDVVVLQDRILVTRFRSAEVLTLDASGAIVRRVTLPSTAGRRPHVAWRMTERHGHVAIAYQLESEAPIDIRKKNLQAQTPYGAAANTSTGDGRPLVVARIATTSDGLSFNVDPTVPPASPMFDVAMSDQGTIAFAGMLATTAVEAVPWAPATAIGKLGMTNLVAVQTRKPSAIQVYALGNNYGGSVPLFTAPISGVSDTGFDVFHTPTQIGIACASCHPEGGDDGHVWRFITVDARPSDGTCPQPGTADHPAAAVPRRTQSLRGGVLKTAPLHWDGDMAGMGDITSEVFTRRMGGGSVSDDQRAILERFIDSIPRLPQRTDLDKARVDAGRTLFEGKGGCSSCHSGSMLTNNATLDVGRGALQVPSLISTGDRAPYLHDGCAKTLSDRFNPSCGGSKHGNALTPEETADVVQYLESL